MAGRRYSKQRELIYEAVRGTDQHPTAEMVYQWLKPTNPNLSLGTVYRNLNLLADDGVLLRLPFSVERYDADTSDHAHLQCRCCGGVSDVYLPEGEALDQAAAQLLPACKIERHELIFHGLCPSCNEVEKASEGAAS